MDAYRHLRSAIIPHKARTLALASVLVAASVVAGCGTPLIANVDQKMSEWTASDCSTDRLVRDGKPYCRKVLPEARPPAVYCEHTLGQVECHTLETPDKGAARPATNEAQHPVETAPDLSPTT